MVALHYAKDDVIQLFMDILGDGDDSDEKTCLEMTVIQTRNTVTVMILNILR